MKTLGAIFLVLCLQLAHPASVLALNLGLGLAHYAMDMEFYYLHPRPEIIGPMLRDFERRGVLAQAEKRMMVAAFMAEALQSYPRLAASLPSLPAQLGGDGRATLAWAVRLAGLPGSGPMLAGLLEGASPALARQIGGCPTPLGRWPIESEKSTLQMYWASFMASGKKVWVLEIVRAACAYARLNERGRQNDPGFAVFQAAAATLYEMAPRHAAVRSCVSEALAQASGPEARALALILENGEKNANRQE